LQGRLVKNSVWNSFGVLTFFGCQWLITIFVVRLSDDYTNAGNLALAMNITNFFTTIALYNIRFFQVSDIKEEYKDSEYIVARAMTCIASLVLCAGFVFIADFSAMQRSIIICYMIFRALDAFLDVLYGIDQKNWRMDYTGISQSSRGVLMLVSFIVFLQFFGLLEAVIAMAVTTLLFGLLFDVSKTRKLAQNAGYKMKQVYALLKRCFPLMIVIMISVVIITFSRYSIARIFDEESLGAYASVTAPTLIVQIAVFSLFAPLTNLFAESVKEKNKTKFIKIFMLTSAVIVLFTFVFVVLSEFFGEWGLNLLFGESIIPYAYLLSGAAIVVGLTTSMWFMNLVFTTIRDIKGLLICNLIGVAVCFATTDFFLNRYELAGANYVMIISQAIALLCLTARLFWFINKKPLFKE